MTHKYNYRLRTNIDYRSNTILEDQLANKTMATKYFLFPNIDKQKKIFYLLTSNNCSKLTYKIRLFFNYAKRNICCALLLAICSTAYAEESEYDRKLFATNSKKEIIFNFVKKNIHGQSILHLSPPEAGGGVNLSFWSAPFNKGNERKRALNIKVHGPKDYYDKGNRHVSFYTQDKHNHQPKAFQWSWGDSYTAIIELPTMGLKIDRIYNEATGDITSPYGIYIANPKLDLPNASIEKNYGIFIEEQTSGESENYSIYSLGTKSYFEGYVGFGVKKPQYQLDIKGDINIDGNILRNGRLAQTVLNEQCDNISLRKPLKGADNWLFFYPYPIEIHYIQVVISGDVGAQVKWNLKKGISRSDLGLNLFKNNLVTSNQETGDIIDLTAPIVISKNNHLRLSIVDLKKNIFDIGLTVCHYPVK